ncbi:MAG: replicative DNA helicase, partial [Bacteroidales bacterium]|nr:replicative DNA helicase [Bacteroidales bacterium]
QLLDPTEQKLMDINENIFRSDYQNISDIVSKAIKEIDEASQKEGGITGIPSGFEELDSITAGFHPGTLVIIAARPAMGKTAFALTMMRNMAIDYKKPVAFFSLEMPATEIAMRLISAQSEIDASKLKKGTLEAWEKEQIMAQTQKLNTAPIYIDDSSQLSIFELRAKCRRLKQRFNIQAVFIDYLQLMKGETDNRNGNREQEISNISRQLKSLSKELSIPVFALAQLSRAVETRGGNKEPQLSDLRESGAIEQDADMVMFLYRPEYYGFTEDENGNPTYGLAKVLLAKHRAGGTGKMDMRFRANYARFENMGATTSNDNTIPVNEGFDQNGDYYVDSKATSDNGFDDADFSQAQPSPDDDF